MPEPSPPRRPALPLATALLAGIALRGQVELAWQELTPWFIAAAALVQCCGSRRLLPRLLLPVCVALLGARAFELACAQSVERTRGWLPADGSALQLELAGTLASAPERGFEGERRVVLVGRPAREERPASGARVLLRVTPSPPETMARIDDLRAGDTLRVWASVRVPSLDTPDC